MLIAEDIQVEWEEGGCYLLVDGERWRVADPEALYDRVKAAILPWLMERDEAFGALRLDAAHRRLGVTPRVFACDPDESGGYADDDPKHPHFHSLHADLWDSREGK